MEMNGPCLVCANPGTNLSDTSDHVVDKGPDCAQTCDMLAATLPHCEGDFVCLPLQQPDVHVNMADVLSEGSSWSSDRNEAGLDGDFNTLWNVELFGLEDVPHLKVWS